MYHSSELKLQDYKMSRRKLKEIFYGKLLGNPHTKK